MKISRNSLTFIFKIIIRLAQEKKNLQDSIVSKKYFAILLFVKIEFGEMIDEFVFFKYSSQVILTKNA